MCVCHRVFSREKRLLVIALFSVKFNARGSLCVLSLFLSPSSLSFSLSLTLLHSRVHARARTHAYTHTHVPFHSPFFVLPSLCLSMYLSIHLLIYLSIDLFVYLPIYLFAYLSVSFGGTYQGSSVLDNLKQKYTFDTKKYKKR